MNRSIVFFFVLSFFCLTGCTKISKVPLEYSSDNASYSLTALNSSAKKDAITKPSKSSYLYYGFPDELCNILRSSNFTTMPAVEITLEVSDFTKAIEQSVDENGKSIVPVFAFSLLRNNDFKDNGRLKNQLEERPLVRGALTGFAGKRFSISLALSANDLLTARGFAFYATAPVKLIRAELKQASLGWNLDVNQVSNVNQTSDIISESSTGENPSSNVPIVGWYGFGPDGGTLIYSEYNHTDFTSGSMLFHGNLPPKITVTLTDCNNDIGSYESQTRVKLIVGSESISIRRAPSQTKVSLCCSALKDYYQPVYVTQNTQMVRSLVMEPTLPEPVLPVSDKSGDLSDNRVLTPISCDPALLLTWDKNTWRTNDYELFRWEQFPNILFFDILDYKIQDSFFKRLAFFVEKKGFRGRLVTDEEIADIHGYNAHDYSATSLATFFETARQLNFPLNNYELLLRDILIENGLIIEKDGKYMAGNGAIISISQESATYLRSTFIAHENFHGLYFIDSDFRSYITQVFNESDPMSLEFLINYFIYTPTLNYDIEDTVLLENEFMAYHIQQSLSRVTDYFAKNLAIRGSVIKADPEHAKYVRDTNGSGFYTNAKKLSEYIFKRWGLASGRVTLVGIE